MQGHRRESGFTTNVRLKPDLRVVGGGVLQGDLLEPAQIDLSCRRDRDLGDMNEIALGGEPDLGYRPGRKALVELHGRHSQVGVDDANSFAVLGIGNPGDRHVMFVDSRRLHDRRLDTQVWNHLAGDLREPAEAVGNLQETVGVDIAQVAGRVPAVFFDLGRRLGTVQVADHHLRSLDGDHPLGACGQINARFGVDRLHGRARQGLTDRAQAIAADLASVGHHDVIGHVDRDDRRKLGAAVALDRVDMKRVLDVSRQLGLELLRTQKQVGDGSKLLGPRSSSSKSA